MSAKEPIAVEKVFAREQGKELKEVGNWQTGSMWSMRQESTSWKIVLYYICKGTKEGVQRTITRIRIIPRWSQKKNG